MIDYIEKGKWLHETVADAGHSLEQRGDGNFYSSDDVAVQAIIDSFNPLPYAKTDAIKSIKDASSSARSRYVTAGAGKDAEYGFKAAEAKQFAIDATVGVFMQGRMTLTGETAKAVADEWNLKSAQWQQLGALIAGTEDQAIADINSQTDWNLVASVAQSYVDKLDAL